MSANRFRFRLWDKKYLKMHTGDIRTALVYPQDEIILMQSTGLDDKNGKEIFEGDILRNPTGTLIDPAEVVLNVVRHVCTPYTSGFDFGTASAAHLIEVIGNVYEQPELLKEAK